MKVKIVCGCVFAFFIILVMPMTNALEIRTLKIQPHVLYVDDDVKKIDVDILIQYVVDLLKEYPDLAEKFLSEFEDTTELHCFDQKSSHLSSTNQTLLEKIYWKVFEYRAFRLYLSTCIFLYHQSKITLLRTITWAMKLLRWVKLGVILGYINPAPQPPEEPVLVFIQDIEQHSLFVASVEPENILWSDIDEIGSGDCDPFPGGYVVAGQKITNCTGILVLRYIPSLKVLGVFEF